MKKIKVYQLAELPENIQQKIFEKWQGIQSEFIEYPREAKDALKKFCDLFCSSDVIIRDTDNYIISDDLENMTGLRLSKWLYNNLNEKITPGKYYSLWSKTTQNPHWTENGSAPWGKLKSRHSKILKERNCPLTGMYYDHVLLEPIYKQIDSHDPKCDLDDILKSSFHNLERAVEMDMEYQNSWDWFLESCFDNYYTEDGIQV